MNEQLLAQMFAGSAEKVGAQQDVVQALQAPPPSPLGPQQDVVQALLDPPLPQT